jgi:hypothetical protein
VDYLGEPLSKYLAERTYNIRPSSAQDRIPVPRPESFQLSSAAKIYKLSKIRLGHESHRYDSAIQRFSLRRSLAAAKLAFVFHEGLVFHTTFLFENVSVRLTSTRA